MTTDRELLEKAANAAGYKGQWDPAWYGMTGGRMGWDPLTNDGDALRLMATLNINVFYRENINGAFVIAEHEGIQFCPESLDGQRERDATRRAIVRAAAALGEKP